MKIELKIDSKNRAVFIIIKHAHAQLTTQHHRDGGREYKAAKHSCGRIGPPSIAQGN
jgi:hypothetical protein